MHKEIFKPESKINRPQADEIAQKLVWMRSALAETGAAALWLKGTDWFAWATVGGSNTVLLAAETGVAEVLVTADQAWILTDQIEAQRLQDEELLAACRGNFLVVAHAWMQPQERTAFIRERVGNGKILCDREVALGDHHPDSALPASLLQHKRTLLPSELERYRQVGRLASVAMTEVLNQAQPDWTEFQLAGAGAKALWERGLHPTLTLAAGERRLPLYRHPTPSHEPLGNQAMLVFCARGYGLYANLTRFVYFGSIPSEIATRHQQVMLVEAAALNACKPGTALNGVYRTLAAAYSDQGYPQAIKQHHQGGTTGYLSREIVANPSTTDTLAASMAIAWNPSLVGVKVEDTFVILPDGSLENLTFDPAWPKTEIEGRFRPSPLER